MGFFRDLWDFFGIFSKSVDEIFLSDLPLDILLSDIFYIIF